MNTLVLLCFSFFPHDAHGAQQPIAVEACSSMPEPVSSFGAARVGPWVYVYGGHAGQPHKYCREDVSGNFRRARVDDLAHWETLPAGEPAQGTALVADGEDLYRVGGMAAENARGETEKLRSTATVSRFDAKAGTWIAQTPLPAPRSSHDACVLDRKLYVVGGWSLAEGDESWHETALVADLGGAALSWRELPKPAQTRRGHTLVACEGRIAVLGGMDDQGHQLRSVAFFDPQGQTWSEGPELPEAGFGVGASVVEGRLVATARSGTVYALDAQRTAWTRVQSLLVPRLFQRQLSLDDGRILVLGGAAKGGRAVPIEVLDPIERGGLQLQSWSLAFQGAQKNREALFLCEGSLHVVGGNNGTEQHDFKPERFEAAGFAIPLATLKPRAIAPFPRPRQSMVACTSSSDAGAAWVVGGFGVEDGVARACDEVYRYDSKADQWSAAGKLPEPRTQFGLVSNGGKLWIFGGMDYDPRRKAQGDAFRYPLSVLALDPTAKTPGFEPAGFEIPRPRRAFGFAEMDGRMYLVGGMRGNFEPVDVCDVYDFATKSWTTIPPPSRPRISPEIAALGGRLYMLGGSAPDLTGDLEFDPSLEVFVPGQGWTKQLDVVPGLTKRTRLLVHGSELLLWSLPENPGEAGALVQLRVPMP